MALRVQEAHERGLEVARAAVADRGLELARRPGEEQLAIREHQHTVGVALGLADGAVRFLGTPQELHARAGEGAGDFESAFVAFLEAEDVAR